ncbi:DNA-processing protein DprA [Leeuwenhoekiella parthenopeia]|uniref:DNA-processing protein DprA n=1 Tax=Leeuwenhoekiella parthenopeia TaxID=2890320 RepID=A0ABS8GR08_9FLAO|nr:DNA-processing protein DprA [Leeuwenhoekiella parthenopeia]MCC4212140.1 DNA-processing protein DprA [Leeuwenhoekiella parthenopeia]
MTQDELHAFLTLQRIPNLGDTSIKRLISRFDSAEQVLRQKKETLLKIDGIGEFRLKAFFDKTHRLEAEEELKFIEANGISYCSFLDADYPQRLKHCVDGPILLFKRGSAGYENPRTLSIVGTRKVTTHGQQFIRKFIEELVPLKPLIVSGFAYGVDIAAHTAALDNELETLAVLAHGLNQLYPKIHAKYQKAVERQGAFITDFWSSDAFDRTNFLRRNRIIAGLAEATLVVESAEKGGSLVTAEIANSYNRDVFAVPGRPEDIQSVGCNNLIKTQKAQLITSAADLVYHLNWQPEEVFKPVQKQLFVELTEEEKIIWRLLSANGREQLDLIALNCGLPTFKTASLLLNMELKGVVRPLPGKLFELT